MQNYHKGTFWVLEKNWYKCRPYNRHSAFLYDFMVDRELMVCNLKQSQTDFTYHKIDNTSYIDYIFRSNYAMEAVINCVVVKDDGCSNSDHLPVKPAAGRTLRPCVSAFPRQLKDASTQRSTCCGVRSAFEQSPCFRSTGNVWTPAYSRPCYRRQNARVEYALLEQLTLFPNASIVLEDVDTHRSNFRRRVNAQTKSARKRTRWKVRSTCGRL